MNCRKQISLTEPKPDIEFLPREVNSPAREPVHGQRSVSAPSTA
jgi:hypothetical protein